MRDGLFEPSYRDARARPMATVFDDNSPNCFSVRSAGRFVTKQVTLTAAGNPVAVNLFVVTGLVRVNEIVGIFEDVTNVNDIEEVRLDAYDGAVSAAISLAAGVVCDGATLGSSIVKINSAAAALAFILTDQVRVEETTKQQNLDPFLLSAKNGVTTYIRMLYKNVDAALNCKVRWYVEWRSYCGSIGTIVPV